MWGDAAIALLTKRVRPAWCVAGAAWSTLREGDVIDAGLFARVGPAKVLVPLLVQNPPVNQRVL